MVLWPTVALAHPIDEVQGEAKLDLSSTDGGRHFDLRIRLGQAHLSEYRQALRDAGLPPEQDDAALHATLGRAFTFAPCALTGAPAKAVTSEIGRAHV